MHQLVYRGLPPAITEDMDGAYAVTLDVLQGVVMYTITLYRTLIEIRCDGCNGRLFGRELSRSAIETWMRSHERVDN